MLDWSAEKGRSLIGGGVRLQSMKAPKPPSRHGHPDSVEAGTPPMQTFISVNSAVKLFEALHHLKKPDRHRPERYTPERAAAILEALETERRKALKGRNLVSPDIAAAAVRTP